LFHPLAICGYLWLVWVLYWYIAAIGASRRKFVEGPLSRLSHALPLGFGMYLIIRGSRNGSLSWHLFEAFELRWIGLALTAAGLLFTVWARAHLGRNWSGIITLKSDHELIRTGPYAYVRHPIYTGMLLAALGSALAANRFDAMLGVCLVLLAFVIKLRREESLLTQEFGDHYHAFKREVPALIPFIY
jgi:hypothetical protein